MSKETGIYTNVGFPGIVTRFGNFDLVLAGAKHFADFGAAKLCFAVDFDCGAAWVGRDL